METIEYRTVDKSAWPSRGEWDDEPDKMQWQDAATGLPCLIVRGPTGALCGYAGVPAGHPWHGVGYDDCKVPSTEDNECGYVDVHGGLTFADGRGHSKDPSRGVCHVPGAGEPDDVWWLGFDCAHLGDCSPAYDRPSFEYGGETYKSIAYVRREVEKLAKQAAEVGLAS